MTARLSLSRKLGSKDYLVTYSGKIPLTSQAVFDFSAKAFAQAPFTVAAIPLSRLLDDPDFVITRVGNKAEGGRQLIRLDFIKTSSSKNTPTTSGWFLVDPRNGFAVREYEIDFTDLKPPHLATKNRAVVEYNSPTWKNRMKRNRFLVNSRSIPWRV